MSHSPPTPTPCVSRRSPIALCMRCDTHGRRVSLELSVPPLLGDTHARTHAQRGDSLAAADALEELVKVLALVLEELDLLPSPLLVKTLALRLALLHDLHLVPQLQHPVVQVPLLGLQLGDLKGWAEAGDGRGARWLEQTRTSSSSSAIPCSACSCFRTPKVTLRARAGCMSATQPGPPPPACRRRLSGLAGLTWTRRESCTRQSSSGSRPAPEAEAGPAPAG